MVLFGNEGREHPPGMLGWAQAFQARRAVAGAAWGLTRNITQTRKKRHQALCRTNIRHLPRK
ncbi:hypothetical protein [Ottowia massiliensis]|jgi:hypothetical protein|uniref:hypothetical protein n=1 Tax=Ottowia massiliensis TaxID=2045302 RepID=UPI0011AEE154|nr:hypothetical protein [Ottowia massiliensis]